MPLSLILRRLAPVAAALALTTALAACDTGLGGFTQTRVEGYDLSPDGLAQIRPGQSQQLVTMVLGSPQLTNDFGDESAYYYVETKATQTSFGLTTINSRTVLAVYFNKNKIVTDRAIYTLKDGKPIAIETRRTPSYGEDRTFVTSILSSITTSSSVPAGGPGL